VLLDLDMPELDGVSALPLLLAKRPGLCVVVVSTLTQRNAEISLKCLRLGATDYLPKPATNREVTTSMSFRQELIGKVKELARAKRGRLSPPAGSAEAAATAVPLATRPRGLVLNPRCVLIGASTGGPKAIADVLTGIAAPLRQVPVLIVQHMPPIFTSVFAEHLAGQTGLPVREAIEGEPLAGGRVYVAPGGRHMGLARGPAQKPAIRLDDGPPVNFCRPAVRRSNTSSRAASVRCAASAGSRACRSSSPA
jgi:two-component system, chemotaxis family, protein-glutamate methylesterase/glutaminase